MRVTITRPILLPDGNGFATKDMRLADPRLPPGQRVTAIKGGAIHCNIPPPPIPLDTAYPYEVLRLLEYAGIDYLTPESEAAHLGLVAFEAGRLFARGTDLGMIAFDWDHVVDNFRIVESLVPLLWTLWHRQYPFKKSYPMVAFETPRPFVHELVFGMMVGFAIEQGIRLFTDWESYSPQVGLATLTWPDRLGILSRYIRLIPLMDGRFPGRKDSYEKTVGSKTFVHLGDFMGYAKRLLEKFRKSGFRGLTPEERHEVMVYLRKGDADNANPLGAMKEKWREGAILLFDDSPEICESLSHESVRRQVLAVHTPNPFTPLEEEVRTRDKFSLGRRCAARALVGAESLTWVPSLVRMLNTMRKEGTAERLAWSPTPPGTVLRICETETTLAEFHDYYLEPTRQVRDLIRGIRRQLGGIRAIERLYKESN